MVSKVTVEDSAYTNILMGTVQAAIAHGVLDAVRAGDIPKKEERDQEPISGGRTTSRGDRRVAAVSSARPRSRSPGDVARGLVADETTTTCTGL